MRVCAARSTVSDCVLNSSFFFTTNLCNQPPPSTQEIHDQTRGKYQVVFLRPNSSSTASFNSFHQHNNLLYICLLMSLCLYKTRNDCCLDKTRPSDTKTHHLCTYTRWRSSNKNNASVNKPQYHATLKYCTYIHKNTY